MNRSSSLIRANSCKFVENIFLADGARRGDALLLSDTFMGELIYAIFRIGAAFWTADERPEARKFTAACCAGLLVVAGVAWWLLK
jgi:hypothetical protein